MMNPIPKYRRASLAALAASAVAVVLAGCVETPPPRPVYDTPPPPPPPPISQVYAYPLHGQTPQQQDRDHYECSTWATQQTGFNPSAPGVPPHERVEVVSAAPPPGTNTAIGAVAGAILGAAIAPSWQAAPAALAGAVVGGAIGSTADAANAQATRTVVVQDRRAAAAQEQQALSYRRAISACLDARGYSVK
ncbi:MAG TPA: glycine zipper 2TM domain-containing protein [Steroidobacteraceae bacterium]|nr:glycine zipper 2TM domain-containing protein [Steroidobacteraceae bacterium]